MIAALFVEEDGCYYNIPDVDPWGISRNALNYAGPHSVVAHPPCERWGKMWFGSPTHPHRYLMGDDGGCFEHALRIVRRYGGVIEHPQGSHAWKWFDLVEPKQGLGWQKADEFGGWTCEVEQGHYGHWGRKRTWLYACKATLPEMDWAVVEQRIPQHLIDAYGYEKARRSGSTGGVRGGNKKVLRARTPTQFRDILLSIARSVPCA